MAEMVLLASIALQLAAAVFALRVGQAAQMRLATALFAAALTLMAGRRALTYFGAVQAGKPVDLTAELIALVISALLFAAVLTLRPILVGIRQRGDMLERLFDSSYILIAYMDTRFNFIRVNRAYAEADGKTPDHYPGKNHFALFPNEENQKIFQRVVDTGEPYSVFAKPFEYAEAPERGVTYWDWTLQPLKNPVGETDGLLLVLMNVTLRIQALQAERENDLRYRLIARAMPNGAVHLFDGDMRFIISDGQLLGSLGLSPDAMEGKTLRECMHNGLCALLEPWFKKTLAGEKAVAEVAYLGRSFMISFTPLTGGGGAVTGGLAVIQEISALKAAQTERLRLASVLEQAADMVMIADASDIIQYINPAFEKATGYRPGDLIGKHVTVLRHGETPTPAAVDMWNTLKAGGAWRGQSPVYRKDGSHFMGEISASPVRGEQGEVINHAWVVQDVTEANALQSAKNYFTTITAHELRTPLTRLNLVRMQMEKGGGVLSARESADALAQIAQCVADFERIASATGMLSDVLLERDKNSFHPLELRLQLLYAAEQIAEQVAREHRAVRVENALADLPESARVGGDMTLLQRALKELLSNAVKFTPDGKAVHLSASIEGRSAVIRIVDEGIGIEPQQAGLLSIPFYSLEDPLKHSTGQYKFKGGGLGLGLVLARAVIGYHGGALTIASEGKNKGTTISVTLPLLETA